MEAPACIDFTKLTFPSDSLSIKTLRKHHPRELDSQLSPDLEEGGHKLGTELRDMLYVERAVAEEAFNRKVGFTRNRFGGSEDREACLSQLSDAYIRYGIASGQHHAAQLIRDIESQAARQASQVMGLTP